MWKILHMLTLKFVTLAGHDFTAESEQEVKRVIKNSGFILWKNNIYFKAPETVLCKLSYSTSVIDLQRCELEPFYERDKDRC